MNKKKTAKKAAKKKKAAPTKRAYNRRKKIEDAPDSTLDTGKGEPFELFRIEKYSGPIPNHAFRFTPEYQKMEERIATMKVKEGFVIRAGWRAFPHKIVNEKQLAIQIRIVSIAGNDDYLRVVRLS